MTASENEDGLHAHTPKPSPDDIISARLKKRGIDVPPPAHLTPEVLRSLRQLLDEIKRLADIAKKRGKKIGRLRERIENQDLSLHAPEDSFNMDDLQEESGSTDILHGEIRVLNEKIRELAESLEEARKNAYIDDLTGLYTRGAFDRALQKRVTRMHKFRDLGPASIVHFDLNFLKSVNDAVGYGAGDAMLKRVAETLEKHTAPHGNIAGRLGGDEFMLLLYNQTETEARALAQAIVDELKETPVRYTDPQGKEYQIPVSLSFGAYGLDYEAVQQAGGRKTEELMHRFVAEAGARMHQQKETGKSAEQLWFIQHFQPQTKDLRTTITDIIGEREKQSHLLLEGPRRTVRTPLKDRARRKNEGGERSR